MRAWPRARAQRHTSPRPEATAAPADASPAALARAFSLVDELLAAALAGADHATLARRVVTEVRTLVGAEICEIVRCVGGELELVAGVGVGGLALDHRIAMVADDPLVEAVVTTTTAAWQRSPGDGPEGVVQASEAPIASALAVPLGDQPDGGVLMARCIGASRLDPHAIEVLTTISSVLTLAQRRRGAEQEAVRRARRDPLTGLANREVFRQRLTTAIDNVEPHSTEVIGVAVVDLDNFALINDGLGHDAGDRLLRAVADRLHHALRPGDLIARFGGDEFVVLARGLRGNDDAIRTGDRLLGSLHDPLSIDGRDLTVRASVGVSVWPTSTDEPLAAAADRVIREADAALGLAKDRGRERVELFTDAIATDVSARLRTERELRAALADDQLEMWFQPIVDVGTGRTAAVEALVRWEHPVRGLVTPADFIPLSETTGLIEEVGLWVVDAVATQLCVWAEEDNLIPIAVNLSPRQLLDDRLVPALTGVLDRLAEAGLDASTLTVEVSEQALSPARADNRAAAVATLRAIAGLGIAITVDDFGAGTGLLSHLRTLPIDAVKIDRGLVARMATSGADYAIVGGLIAVARAIGTTVVASGVETDDQFALLADLGCDLAQGHLFSPAVRELRRAGTTTDQPA